MDNNAEEYFQHWMNLVTSTTEEDLEPVTSEITLVPTSRSYIQIYDIEAEVKNETNETN